MTDITLQLSDTLDSTQYWPLVQSLNKHELEALEQAMSWRQNQIYAERLSAIQGLKAFWRIDDDFLDFILVFYENDREGELATPEECQILLDTIANLPLDEAWNRWVWKKEARCDQEIFDIEVTRTIGSKAIDNFRDSEYGQQFPEDVTYTRQYGNDIVRDTWELINSRKAMQQEFLSMVEAEGLEAVREKWIEVLTELGQKYQFGRNHVRDAIRWALQNKHLLINKTT